MIVYQDERTRVTPSTNSLKVVGEKPTALKMILEFVLFPGRNKDKQRDDRWTE